MNSIAWLLEDDPAIRWQTMSDLTTASPDEIAAERARVPYEGLGAALLAAQGEDGPWHRPDEPDWLPTLFSLQLLRATGIDPAAPVVASAIARLQAGYRWADEFGAKPFSEGEVEPCINGGALAASSYFGHASQDLAHRLVREQLADGGWNCDAPKSTRSSFHTTICVLEGLLEFERAVGAAPEVTAARARGEEYLLTRNLFRRRSTGEIANPAFLELAFPPRYHYDILRALDYFRIARPHSDERLREPLHILATRRTEDGRWPLDRDYNETSVPLQEAPGQPSRWNTLRALRVLAVFRSSS